MKIDVITCSGDFDGGCDSFEDSFEIKDDATPEEIKKAAQRKALSHITYSYAASAGCEKGSGSDRNV